MLCPLGATKGTSLRDDGPGTRRQLYDGQLTVPAEEVCGMVMHSILGRGHAITSIPSMECPVSAATGGLPKCLPFVSRCQVKSFSAGNPAAARMEVHIAANKNLEWSAQVKCPETDGDSPWPDSLNTFEGCDTQVGFDDYPLWVS